jgi:excisionase family DNA binding protein
LDFCGKQGHCQEKETDMPRNFLPLSYKLEPNRRFVAPEFEPLLNSEQAAELLQIHHKTLQKLARRGEIHGTHIGKLWRFRASDLNDWLQKQRAS